MVAVTSPQFRVMDPTPQGVSKSTLHHDIKIVMKEYVTFKYPIIEYLITVLNSKCQSGKHSNMVY